MRTFNIIAALVLSFLLANLLVGGIDLVALVFGLSFFMRAAITLTLAAAFFQLRSIAKQ